MLRYVLSLIPTRSSTPTTPESRGDTPSPRTPILVHNFQDETSRISPSSPNPEESKRFSPLFHSKVPQSILSSPVEQITEENLVQEIFGSMFLAAKNSKPLKITHKVKSLTLLVETKNGLKEKTYFLFNQQLIQSSQNTIYALVKKTKEGKFKKYVLAEPKTRSVAKNPIPFEASKLSLHKKAAEKNLALKVQRVVSSVESGLNPLEGKFPLGTGPRVVYDPRFITPFADKGDLLCFLNKNQEFSDKDRLSLSLKILKKFDSLHKMGIIHRDIKPDNILLRGDEPFICDFGFAEKQSISSKACGSTKFVPPEYFPTNFMGIKLNLINPPKPSSGFRTKNIDLYTLGSTLFTLLTSMHLEEALLMHRYNILPTIDLDEWNNKTYEEFADFRKNYVKETIAFFMESYPSAVIEVIQGLTELNPEERLPLKKALQKWELEVVL